MNIRKEVGWWWNTVLKPMFRPPKVVHPTSFKDDKVLEWSIYGDNLKVSDFAKIHKRIHTDFKYRFLIPLIRIAQKYITGKKGTLTKPRKHHWHDKTMTVFDKAFDNSMYEWIAYYLAGYDPDDLNAVDEDKIRAIYKNDKTTYLMPVMKDVGMTMMLNDTAYREFFNILMFNITIEMNKAYPEKANHLFYHSRHIAEVSYFKLGKTIVEHQLNEVGTNKKTAAQKSDVEKRVKPKKEK